MSYVSQGEETKKRQQNTKQTTLDPLPKREHFDNGKRRGSKTRTKAMIAFREGKEEFMSEGRMDRFMEHVAQRHMLPMQFQRNSYFLSTDREYVYAIVKETMETPDTILPHKYKRYRGVKKKRFLTQVGVHGISGAPCYCVTVIFGATNNEIISAFPTM